MSASDLLCPRWRKLTLQAVIEMKPNNMTEKIKIAEIAIAQRLRELEGNPGLKDERDGLHNAVQTLRNLESVVISEGRHRFWKP